MSGAGYRVAVVGATGQVGTLMLQLLSEREFPAPDAEVRWDAGLRARRWRTEPGPRSVVVAHGVLLPIGVVRWRM